MYVCRPGTLTETQSAFPRFSSVVSVALVNLSHDQSTMKGYQFIEDASLTLAAAELVKGRERKYDTINGIPRVPMLSADTFFTEYMHPNRPVLIGREMTNGFRARREWVDSEGGPAMDTLEALCGDSIVPVADCRQVLDGAHCKKDMTMREYAAWWRQNKQGQTNDGSLLYLKDWHFVNAFPDYRRYTTPECFREDWFNPPDGTVDPNDYRFVYLGPKGSFTPLHADVLRSYSWSINICGRKHWTLFRPDEVRYLRDSKGVFIHDIRHVDLDQFPDFPKTRPLVLVQEPGEAIFVPSGWYHQVVNLEDTLSVNHNWANACIVDLMFAHLKDELGAVQKEIEEFRTTMDDWDDHCQLLLKALAGMDYHDLYTLISSQVGSCMDAIQDVLKKGATPPAWCHHLLAATVPVMDDMLHDPIGKRALENCVDLDLFERAADQLKILKDTTNEDAGEH